MEKMEYISHEKNGVSYITTAPILKPATSRMNLMDRVLIAALLAGIAGLVIFLVK